MKWIQVPLFAALFLDPTGIGAQVSPTQEIPSALASVRRGHASAAAALLANEKGALTGRQSRELVDSLVSIATSASPGDPPSAYKAAGAARDALLIAAIPDRGTPFPRAFEALVRVFEGAQEPGVKAGTLAAMTHLPGKGQVSVFMADVASSDDSHAAATAVTHLGQDLGAVGLNRLRELFTTSAVVDPVAKGRLQGIAYTRGWGGRLRGMSMLL